MERVSRPRWPIWLVSSYDENCLGRREEEEEETTNNDLLLTTYTSCWDSKSRLATSGSPHCWTRRPSSTMIGSICLGGGTWATRPCACSKYCWSVERKRSASCSS